MGGGREGCSVSDRYARQITLPEVGVEGQARIRAATVLVVGAGGLGCALLQYLGAAGIGRIVIVDHDRIEAANLHRQPLYRMGDLGRFKADVAGAALRELNPTIDIDSVCERLTPANAKTLVPDADVVIDGADSFAVTYTLSDECARAGKPLVSASVLGLSGYAGVFCGGAPSYRAVFPEMPSHAGSCAGTGVLGTAVGVMGTLQAQMVLSLILRLQPPVLGRLITVDFRSLRFGGFSFASAREPAEPVLAFIAPSDASAADLIVDLRSTLEAPTSVFPSSVRIAVEEIEIVAGQTTSSQRIVLCCRSGVRAWRAAATLRAKGHTNLALVAMGD
jgi:molybdopterin/thiamine biosynthesis adenylyltransferase/rhodanese-related sulfurtransferase